MPSLPLPTNGARFINPDRFVGKGLKEAKLAFAHEFAQRRGVGLAFAHLV